MRAESSAAVGASSAFAIHASAVAIDGRALLICGPSRSGKSRLVVALVAASTRRRPVRFLGDDRILLSTTPRGLVARPHPRIAGFLERRGLGIVAMRHVASAPVAAIVELALPRGAAMAEDGLVSDRPFAPTTMRSPVLENFPVLPIVDEEAGHARCARVLEWWGEVATATSRQHPGENGCPQRTSA